MRISLIKFKRLVKKNLGYKIDCHYKKDGLILSKDGIEFLCLHYDESGNVDLSDTNMAFYIKEIARVLENKRNAVLQEISLVVTRTKDRKVIEHAFKGIKCIEVEGFVCTFMYHEGLVSSDFIKCLEISDEDLVFNANVNMALQANTLEVCDLENKCEIVSGHNGCYMAGLGLNKIYLNGWHSDVYLLLGSIHSVMVAPSKIGIDNFRVKARSWFRAISDDEKLCDCIYKYCIETEKFYEVGRL